MLAGCHIALFLTITVHQLLAADNGIASKLQSGRIHKRCPYTLKKLWQTDVSSFPFAAAPLVVDVDGDGGFDVIAAPFGESLAVLEGESGKPLHDTNWPQHNLDKSVHSTPLQYDIDGDGVLDILFVTTQGEGLFYTGLGHTLSKYNFQIEPAYVKSDWYKDTDSADHHKIHGYVTRKPTPGHIAVDPHVLSSPVIHGMHLLVLPVSYYFNDDEYEGAEGPWGSADAKEKFYIGSVAVVDLQQLMMNRNRNSTSQNSGTITIFHLELSQKPMFNLFSPTVLDVDGSFGIAEVITGLSSGNLYVMSLNGVHRDGFPKNMGSISGRVSAADLDGELGLELVMLNTSGSVLCIDSLTGRNKWVSHISGRVFAGAQITDVDLDGQLDVVVATDEGDVYALHGTNGSVLPHYPFKSGSRIASSVLITKFNALRGAVDLVFLSEDGTLHILAGDHSCLSEVTLTDFSLVDITVQNIVLLNRGVELLVATADGSLICLGSGRESSPEELYEDEYLLSAAKLAYPSSPHSQNDFAFTVNKVVALIDSRTKHKKEVTGSMLDLYFTVRGADRGQKLDVQVYIGSVQVHNEMTTDLESRWLQVPTPELPGQAQVTIVVIDQYGFVSSDSTFLRFNQLILLDLQWLVLAPFIAMVIILLVNHGFPAKDLLPVTYPVKSK